MFSQPWYYNYAPEASYNPFGNSACQRPSQFHRAPARSTWNQWAHEQAEQAEQERALNDLRALMEQRARRAQWLPDEEDNSDDDTEYSQLGPRQRACLDAVRRQEAMERLRAEEQARRERLIEEQRRQQEAARRQMEEEQEARKRLLEERRRQMQQRREEDARRLSEAFERGLQSRLHQQQARSQSRTPSTHQASNSISSASQQSSQSPRSPTWGVHPKSTTSSHSSTPQQVYGDEHQEAALHIQKQFRIHQSYRSLDNLSSQFQELKRNFVHPASVDFQNPATEEGHITVRVHRTPSDFEVSEDATVDTDASMDVDTDASSETKLAYTSGNHAIHQYIDQMDKILMKLDGVESWNEKGVRTKRKAIVKEIEQESARLERFWRQAWKEYVEEQQEMEQAEEKQDVEEVEMATPALEEPLLAPAQTMPSATSATKSTPALPLELTSSPSVDTLPGTTSEDAPQTPDEQALQEEAEESETEDLVTIPADVDEEAWALEEPATEQPQPQESESKEDSDVHMAGDEWVDVGKTEL